MAVTLITPTSGRPEAFKLCERWMARQTYRGEIQWIVADDGGKPAPCTLGQEHIRRSPSSTRRASFRGNLLAALERVRCETVLFIEDDDWYAPHYLEEMVSRLASSVLAGEAKAKYYHVGCRCYRLCGNTGHASLSQTGIRQELVPLLIKQILRTRTTAVDVRLWRNWASHRPRALEPRSKMVVGMKGLPGKAGIGIGHRPKKRWPRDPQGRVLREWIGDDAEVYLDVCRDVSGASA